MKKLHAEDLLSLECYARERAQFRTRVIAHRQLRRLAVGPSVTWSFEDRLTVQYQVQEMLRIERIFELPSIEEELASYNPLIPDGSNLKATMLIEIPDPELRRQQLPMLKNIEDRCWLQVAGHAQVFAIADEDMDRSNDEKTSAVHFLRFELASDMRTSAKAGAGLTFGVDHDHYRYTLQSPPIATMESLRNDLE
jgi:Protein of unknown function (DUF3501)